MPQSFDVLILGAGAAGLMCAIEAGKRGRSVAVLERSERAGKKIIISGGGRCNFTNIHCTPDNFLSSNPHFAKSALARYTPSDFIALVEKHSISYHEKTLGQLFCDLSSKDIVNMLEAECRELGARIFLNTSIAEVSKSGEFVVRAGENEFRAPCLVIATGGLPIPKMGATSFGYDLARQFGLAIREPRPALVPFVLAPEDRDRYCDLAGVSAEVIASFDGQRFREKMLVTHRGLSGPAILQISSYWKPGHPIGIDLAPDQDVTTALRQPNAVRNLTTTKSAFQQFLPNRFANRWLEINEPKSWTNVALAQLENQMHQWTVTPAGIEGFAKAEVTTGGIDTDELSAKTMESKKVPGLFFIGEVVDVTGHLGGFNFQWAWASGAAAGRAM
ncbi:MAG TPA: NAD(P)/FAD-dependent oxidoreductase [Terriglobales bacterium]|nr:NAD(P)/FAD-dependent oxidoreductase [Terriglobales bacterium]